MPKYLACMVRRVNREELRRGNFEIEKEEIEAPTKRHAKEIFYRDFKDYILLSMPKIKKGVKL